jgi:hypothetical protein
MLDCLEKRASELLGEKMERFAKLDKSKIIACPWLNWRRPDATRENIQGIFIMQDWWNCSDGLKADVDYIGKHDFPYNGKRKDRTNHNLFKADAWKKAIWCDKTWLVTNAVWGIRKSKSGKNQQSGYLGDPIHKAAFPIWAELVRYFAFQKTDFKVVFAGGWAVFENAESNDEDLKKYLENWKEWAGKGTGENVEVPELNFNDVKGNVYFSCHPSVWNFRFNCLDGPPPNRV